MPYRLNHHNFGYLFSCSEASEDVSNKSDCDRAIEAVGIFHGVKSFNFVVALPVFKKIFSVSANLSDALQSESIHLAAASSLIQSNIDTFKGLRSDDHWGLYGKK